MFEQLVESGRRSPPRLRHSAVSIGLHTGLVLAVIATTPRLASPARIRPPTASDPIYRVPLSPPGRSPKGNSPRGGILPPRDELPPILPATDRVVLVGIPSIPGPPDIRTVIESDMRPGGLDRLGEVPAEPGPVAEVPPVRLDSLEPAYPAVLRSSGLDGRVELEYVVDTLGAVDSESVRLVKADVSAFVPFAKAAVLGFRFRPGQRGRRPIRVRVTQAIVYRLR